MKKFMIFSVLILLIAVSQAHAARPNFLSMYEKDVEIHDLGALEGGGSTPYAINNYAQTVGDATTATGANQAFFHNAWNMRGVNEPAGTVYSKARAVNDDGQIAGYRKTASGGVSAFIYDKSGYTNLGTLGGNSYAQGMNDSGKVVGYSQTKTGDTHAFMHDGIEMRDLGTLGGNFSIAKDISDVGGVTGYASTETGDTHAFAYCAGFGQMRDLGTLGGRNSYGHGVNRLGHTVGYSETAAGQSRAFLHDGDAMNDLGTLGGDNSYANGINAFDFVVGSSETADGKSHAYVYHEKAFWYYDTTMVDLNDFLEEDSGWDSLNIAYDINEWGQIIGVGTKGGERHAFLLTPVALSEVAQVPIPGAHLLLGSCLALLGIRRRR